MTCGKIVPRQSQISGVGERFKGYLAECILPSHHHGCCVFKTPEGRYFAWERDDCDCCSLEDCDGCYIYWEITLEEFEIASRGES